MPDNHDSPREGANLRYFVAVVRTRLWIVLLCVVLTGSLSLFLSSRQTPIYKSTAEVLVKPPFNPAEVISAGDLLSLETELEIADSEEVAGRAARELGPDSSTESVLESLNVEVPANTQILLITFADPDPALAQAGAQAVADSYLDYKTEERAEALAQIQEPLNEHVEDLLRQLQDLQDEVGAGTETPAQELEREVIERRLLVLGTQLAPIDSVSIDPGTILTRAALPSSPSSPNHLVNILIGIAIGLILGLVLVILRERLDETVRGRRELELHTGEGVIGVIPRIRGRRQRKRLAVQAGQKHAGAAEAYRALRAGVMFLAKTEGIRVLMVTSAEPGDGKTTTAANLAASLAQAGKQVILISGDLRGPGPERFFSHGYSAPEPSLGLSGYLTGDAFAAGASPIVKSGIPRLRLVQRGTSLANPGELIGSDAMRALLDRCRQEADIVVIDTAPLLSVSDALGLAPLTDGVLFVARAGVTTGPAIQEALTHLDQVGGQVIGSVLNATLPSPNRAYPYQRGYYPRRSVSDHDGRVHVAVPTGSRVSPPN